MSQATGFVSQYYELSLRVRTRDGQWSLVVFGPNGLLISHDKKYDSATAALQAALDVARMHLQEKGDARPVLETVDWQPA